VVQYKHHRAHSLPENNVTQRRRPVASHAGLRSALGTSTAVDPETAIRLAQPEALDLVRRDQSVFPPPADGTRPEITMLCFTALQ